MKMIEECLSRYAMLSPGTRVLCAVSGGSDSVCLLHWLMEHRESLGVELFAAHYQHGIRAGESLRDAHFVKELCDGWGIPCIVEDGDVPKFAGEKGLGLEEAARKLRYAFLERTADELSCTRIATAHNANDNAETMLFNLARGSGASGLGGIPPVRGRIIRPLLFTDRREIEAYLEARGIPHVEDSSNQSDEYSRNLIRHRVMPVMNGLNPEFAEAAGRAALLLRQDDEYLCSLAADFIAAHSDGESIDAAALLRLAVPVSSRVLRAHFKKSLSMEHVEKALRLCRSTEYAELSLPGGVLRAEQGRLYFSAARQTGLMSRQLVLGEELSIPECGLVLRTHFAVYAGEINDLFKTYYFKSGNICGNIFCTGRKSGDSMRLQGRGCSKSLKKLFTEARMTQAQRDQTVVLRDEVGPLAVYGLGIAERTCANPGDRVIVVEIEKEETGRRQ